MSRPRRAHDRHLRGPAPAEARDFYGLERLWGEAELVELIDPEAGVAEAVR